MEIQILNFIQTLRNPVFDQFFKVFTTLGNHGELWFVILALCALNTKTRKVAWIALIALGTEVVFVNLVVKNIIQRPRPFYENTDILLLVKAPSGYSFPSGHAASSFAVATVLWISRVKYRGAVCFLAVLMAFSRLYVYVHYPTDVLAGAIVGIAVGVCVTTLYPKIESMLRERKKAI